MKRRELSPCWKYYVTIINTDFFSPLLKPCDPSSFLTHDTAIRNTLRMPVIKSHKLSPYLTYDETIRNAHCTCQ